MNDKIRAHMALVDAYETACATSALGTQSTKAEIARLALQASAIALHAEQAEPGFVLTHIYKADPEAAAKARPSEPPETPVEPVREREAFQVHWERENGVPMNSRTRDDGSYGVSSIQAAWETWLAGSSTKGLT